MKLPGIRAHAVKCNIDVVAGITGFVFFYIALVPGTTGVTTMWSKKQVAPLTLLHLLVASYTNLTRCGYTMAGWNRQHGSTCDGSTCDGNGVF